jgi:hypothetical protein
VGQQAITIIANHFEKKGADIDRILAALRPLSEPISLQDMVTIVALHARFTAVLAGVTTDGKTPRSFASKYLHFHNPVVPIYDSYAVAGIARLVRWDASEIPFVARLAAMLSPTTTTSSAYVSGDCSRPATPRTSTILLSLKSKGLSGQKRTANTITRAICGFVVALFA